MFDFVSIKEGGKLRVFQRKTRPAERAEEQGRSAISRRACIGIAAGEEMTLAEIDGPGCIEHIWITGAVSRHFIFRIYWDGQENPSVEAPLPAFFDGPMMKILENVDGRYPCLNSAM